jgi:hypothetical protein
MKNNVSIDELFRSKLAQGVEQLTLSAWPNMERMLDGKNPYQDEKKKRRILPFFWIVIVSSLLLTAGYYVSNYQKTNQLSKSHSTQPSVQSSHAKISTQEPNYISTHANTRHRKNIVPNQNLVAYHTTTKKKKSTKTGNSDTEISTIKSSPSHSSIEKPITETSDEINTSTLIASAHTTSSNNDLKLTTANFTKRNTTQPELASTKSQPNLPQQESSPESKNTTKDTVIQYTVNEKWQRNNDGVKVLIVDTVDKTVTLLERAVEPTSLLCRAEMIQYNPRYVASLA